MVVYILIGAVYHENDFAVIGTFSTEAKAEKQKAKQEITKEFEYYQIIQSEVDKGE